VPPAPAPATLAPSPEAQAYLDAVRKGDVAGVEKALAAGIAVDTPFRYNRTALSFAADRGQVEIVRMLLAKGANPEATDSYYNQTPLGWASQPAQTRRPEHAEVVKLLLGKGAKGAGRAFANAVGASDGRMVQVILEAGALPPAVLNESLAAAKKDNKAEIVAALEKAGATMPVIATLTPAQLARYPGTYNDGRTDAVLTLKDGALVAVVGGGQPVSLSPRSETSFVLETVPGVTLTFTIEGEQATSLTVVNQAGVSAVYKRVAK
jgi:ankyrin repeat protein